MSLFLVTGLPRMRSAWLAALFSGESVECWHDAVHHGSIEQMVLRVRHSKAPVSGLCDPGAACAYPRLALDAFSASPIILVRRSESSSLQSSTVWAGQPPNWEEITRNHAWFVDHAMSRMGNQVHWVKFADLDDFSIVSEVYRLCTAGLSLDKRRFELFNTLRIEQHREKAAQAAAQFQ